MAWIHVIPESEAQGELAKAYDELYAYVNRLADGLGVLLEDA